jgi:hypothetical protein
MLDIVVQSNSNQIKVGATLNVLTFAKTKKKHLRFGNIKKSSTYKKNKYP